MRAIDRENLELLTVHATHPAGNVRGLPIRWIRDRVSIRRETRLALRKLVEPAKREPGLVAWSPFANHGRKDVAHDRHGQDQTDGPIKEDAQFHQHATSRKP